MLVVGVLYFVIFVIVGVCLSGIVVVGERECDCFEF